MTAADLKWTAEEEIALRGEIHRLEVAAPLSAYETAYYLAVERRLDATMEALAKAPIAKASKPVLYIPAMSGACAERIAYAIDNGRVPALPHYLDLEAAAGRAAELGRPGYRHAVFEVPAKATDDGWVRVARIVNSLGEIAATFLLVIAGCWAVGIGSLI